MNLSPSVIGEIKDHALREYPKESCGIIAGGRYIPCENISDDPVNSFKIHPKKWIEHGRVETVVHSHTFIPKKDEKGNDLPPGVEDIYLLDAPSAEDMEGQVASSVPWLVVATDGKVCLEPFFFGDCLERQPLLQRKFRHGITDCYAIIRDAFHFGKIRLAEQGVTTQWPFDPIDLPEFYRTYGWWKDGGDLYRDGFEKAGFVNIGEDAEPRVGDVPLAQIRSNVPNHAGVYVGNGLIVHHLMGQLSKRDPVGPWRRKYITHWLRFAG